MTKFEETINFLKNKDEFFAAKYDELIDLIKKSRTSEGAGIEVTIEGVSPMPEDEEGYPVSSKILSRVTIRQGKTVTVLTIANISREMLAMPENTTSRLAKIETTTKRLIGKKRKVYVSRVAHIDNYYMYYGEEEGSIVSEIKKEVPVNYYDLSDIAEIGRSHIV